MKWVDAVPVESKPCGSCSLCCKLFDIDWLDKPKPAGKWCHNCTPGKGCAIWQSVPARCADYYCVWRLDPELPAEWRPDRARFVLTHAHVDAPLAVLLDPGAPDAHRREPYKSLLARTARQILEGRGSTIVVFNGQHRTLLFPDCEIAIPDGVALHDIRIEGRNGPNGHVWRPVFPNH
ncbi:MAG: hypothetical protein FD175_29 [Beijerinckiaceae bacterium]|nr:MAG: hypothetical protein FD175_29 [Beijerinckiaceae bacterium]